MPSPKDELIADLRGQVAILSNLLEMALHRQEPEVSPGAARQRRYRERLASQSDVTGDVTRNVTGDKTPRESNPLSSSTGDVTNVPLNPNLVGNSLSEPVSRNVTKVTPWDQDRAADDAAKHGLDSVAFEAELQRFQDYWDSCGWRRRSGPVKDRNATWRSWLDSPHRNGRAHGGRSDPQASIREWAAKHNTIEGQIA